MSGHHGAPPALRRTRVVSSDCRAVPVAVAMVDAVIPRISIMRLPPVYRLPGLEGSHVRMHRRYPHTGIVRHVVARSTCARYGAWRVVRRQIGEMLHVREGGGRASGAQALGMSGPTVASARESKDPHLGGDRRLSSSHAALDHQARLRRCTHAAGGEQDQIRRRIAARNLRRTENVRIQAAKQAETDSECRSRAGPLLEATQALHASMSRAASIPAVALSSDLNAAAVRCRSVSPRSAGNFRP